MIMTQVQPSGKGPEMYFWLLWRSSQVKEITFYIYIYLFYPSLMRFLDQRQTDLFT